MAKGGQIGIAIIAHVGLPNAGNRIYAAYEVKLMQNSYSSLCTMVNKTGA